MTCYGWSVSVPNILQVNSYRCSVSAPDIHLLVLPTSKLLRTACVSAFNIYLLVLPTPQLFQTVCISASNIHLMVLPTSDLLETIQTSIFWYCLLLNCYKLPVSMLQTSVFWYCLHTAGTDCVSAPNIHLLVLPTPELLQTACVSAPNISSGTAYTWTVTDCLCQCFKNYLLVLPTCEVLQAGSSSASNGLLLVWWIFELPAQASMCLM